MRSDERSLYRDLATQRPGPQPTRDMSISFLAGSLMCCFVAGMMFMSLYAGIPG